MEQPNISKFEIPETFECVCCMDPVEEQNAVLYVLSSTDKWKLYDYCKSCTEYMIKNNWNMYKDSLQSIDCKRNFINILKKKCTNKLQTLSRENIYKVHYDEQTHDSILSGSFDDETVNKINDEYVKYEQLVSENKEDDTHFDNFIVMTKTYFFTESQ